MKTKITALRVAMTLSVGLHALLLLVRFSNPQAFDRIFDEKPIEVILVNARTLEVPVKAQAIAQVSLEGGGDHDAGRATAPQALSEETRLGDAEEDKLREIEELKESQTQMLAQLKSELEQLNTSEPTEQAAGESKAKSQEERRKQLTALLAEIENRIKIENARPRKRLIGPSTKEEAYATYYDQLRRKLEHQGTANFPQNEGRRLYGELTVNFTVDSRGRVIESHVVRRSDTAVLDRQALAIVMAASPFGEFSDAMKRKADQLVITSRLKFTRDSGLETTLTTTGS